jgi:hypothetical protein
VSWMPNPTVTIAGQDYTGRTVDSVSLRRGRDTVYASPQAGYATVALINTGGMVEPVVGDLVTVTLDDSSSVAQPLFSGFVSDWQSDVVSLGGSVLVRYSVQVVGLLARLNRRTVLADGRPAELDGARVLAALGAGLPTPWGEFSTLTTWGDVAADVTWATVDPGFDPALIDGGVYGLVALGSADAGYSALQVVQDAGASAKGLLFETADGFVGYADADRRPANAAAGFLDVPFGVLDVGGVSVSSSLADLTNRVSVEYGSDQVVEDEDAFSIGQFGLQTTRLSTLLASESDAEARAADFLFSHSKPARELQSLTVNLRSSMSDVLRDALIAIGPNDALKVTGAPTSVLPNGFRGFVEGVQWRVNDFEAVVTLLVSDENLSFGSVLWGQVDATISWQDVDGALTWADARRVTV